VERIKNNPILTDRQKALLEYFQGWAQSSKFYLTGGTALSAFYLQHRLSDDLDFFTEEDVETESVLGFLKSLPEMKDLSLERKFDRRIFLIVYEDGGVLRTEFTRYPYERIEPSKIVEGINVDAMTDILANKFMALTDRRDIKDYVDIYFILRECSDISVIETIKKAEAKFGIKGLIYILEGRFLECPGGVEMLRMEKECENKEIITFFEKMAREFIRKSIENEP
jgi:predicted nucleotidyltransferase component of viral defense system